jgi:hypothetical protein
LPYASTTTPAQRLWRSRKQINQLAIARRSAPGWSLETPHSSCGAQNKRQKRSFRPNPKLATCHSRHFLVDVLCALRRKPWHFCHSTRNYVTPSEQFASCHCFSMTCHMGSWRPGVQMNKLLPVVVATLALFAASGAKAADIALPMMRAPSAAIEPPFKGGSLGAVQVVPRRSAATVCAEVEPGPTCPPRMPPAKPKPQQKVVGPSRLQL